jgi:hypothetical protein
MSPKRLPPARALFPDRPADVKKLATVENSAYY